MEAQKTAAVFAILDAIIESVKAGGSMGAPGGILYAALMAHGCTLDQFNQLMTILVRSGRLDKRGECYHVAAEKEAA